ncbi:unnamed protein product [Malus baccata var. baccata]
MMTILSSKTMDIPDGVKIKVHARIIEKLKVKAWFGSLKISPAIRTALSHIGNLITDITKGYRYKVHLCLLIFLSMPPSLMRPSGYDDVSITQCEKVQDNSILDGNEFFSILKFLDGIYVSEKGTIVAEE